MKSYPLTQTLLARSQSMPPKLQFKIIALFEMMSSGQLGMHCGSAWVITYESFLEVSRDHMCPIIDPPLTIIKLYSIVPLGTGEQFLASR